MASQDYFKENAMSGKRQIQNSGSENENTYPNAPVVNTIQPFIGNNAQLIAAQLAAGGYGTPEQLTAQGQQIYAPTHSVGLFEPLTETKAAIAGGSYDKQASTGLLALDKLLGVGISSPNTTNNSNASYGGSLLTPWDQRSYYGAGLDQR